MKPTAFILLIPALWYTNSSAPTLHIISATAGKVTFIYKTNSSHEKLVYIKCDAFINNEWVMIDDNVLCNQLQATYIFSCGPTRITGERKVALDLSNCEYLPKYDPALVSPLKIRIITFDGYNTNKKAFKAFYIPFKKLDLKRRS